MLLDTLILHLLHVLSSLTENITSTDLVVVFCSMHTSHLSGVCKSEYVLFEQLPHAQIDKQTRNSMRKPESEESRT